MEDALLARSLSLSLSLSLFFFFSLSLSLSLPLLSLSLSLSPPLPLLLSLPWGPCFLSLLVLLFASGHGHTPPFLRRLEFPDFLRSPRILGTFWDGVCSKLSRFSCIFLWTFSHFGMILLAFGSLAIANLADAFGNLGKEFFLETILLGIMRNLFRN